MEKRTLKNEIAKLQVLDYKVIKNPTSYVRAIKKLDCQVLTTTNSVGIKFATFPNRMFVNILKTELNALWNSEAKMYEITDIKSVKTTDLIKETLIKLSKITEEEIVDFAKSHPAKSHKRFHKKSNGTQEQEQPKVETETPKVEEETKETKAKKTKKVAKPTQAKAKVDTKVSKNSTKDLVNATLSTLNETIKCLNELVKKL